MGTRDEQARATARKRLRTIEKRYGRRFKSKLKAFDWADDPAAALAALMRRAGIDPRSHERITDITESHADELAVKRGLIDEYINLHKEYYGFKPYIRRDELMVMSVDDLYEMIDELRADMHNDDDYNRQRDIDMWLYDDL